MARKTHRSSAPETILSALDTDPALLDYHERSEIEALAIADIKSQLAELGLPSSMPDELQKVIDSASATELLGLLDDQKVESLPLDEVTARLQELGISYHAGLAEVIDLAEEHARVSRSSERHLFAKISDFVGRQARRATHYCNQLLVAAASNVRPAQIWIPVGAMAALVIIILGVQLHQARVQLNEMTEIAMLEGVESLMTGTKTTEQQSALGILRSPTEAMDVRLSRTSLSHIRLGYTDSERYKKTMYQLAAKYAAAAAEQQQGEGRWCLTPPESQK